MKTWERGERREEEVRTEGKVKVGKVKERRGNDGEARGGEGWVRRLGRQGGRKDVRRGESRWEMV